MLEFASDVNQLISPNANVSDFLKPLVELEKTPNNFSTANKIGETSIAERHSGREFLSELKDFFQK